VYLIDNSSLERHPRHLSDVASNNLTFAYPSGICHNLGLV